MTSKKKASPKTPGEDATPDLSFESTLEELEALVDQMETGEVSLEGSLEAFERGVKLTRACQATLKQAELRIQTLSAENQDIVPTEAPSKE